MIKLTRTHDEALGQLQTTKVLWEEIPYIAGLFDRDEERKLGRIGRSSRC